MERYSLGVLLSLALGASTANAQYTPWTTPVNLGPVINSQYLDSCVTISKSGLSLFFGSTRWDYGKSGAWHLFVSKRDSVDSPWGDPQEVTGFNDGYHTTCPALSPDEHRMFFASSTRPGGCGGNDLWVSRRHDRRDDFGWQTPVNLGCTVNSAAGENVPTVFEDESGAEILYFTSTRSGKGDMYATRLMDDDTYSPPVPVAELSSPNSDYAAVRKDGLEVILSSDRPGGLGGGGDLWTSTRASTSDPWAVPVLLTVLSSPDWEGGHMSFSFDGRAFYFTSTRPGGFGSRDLYVATREKLRH